MGKSSDFVLSLKSHLEAEFLETRVDAVVVTHRSIIEAIDAGIIKNTRTSEVSRVERAILIRRTNEDISETRAGDRRRLTSAGVFDIAVLVNSSLENDEAKRDNDEAIALEIMDLSDEVQDSVEDTTVAGAYSVSIRSVIDVSDPSSKFYGSIISVEAYLLHV